MMFLYLLAAGIILATIGFYLVPMPNKNDPHFDPDSLEPWLTNRGLASASAILIGLVSVVISLVWGFIALLISPFV